VPAAIIPPTAIERLKPTLLDPSASHSERLFLPPKQSMTEDAISACNRIGTVCSSLGKVYLSR